MNRPPKVKPSPAAEEGTPPSTRTLWRLLKAFFPYSPLFFASILATGLYAGMMTVRVALIYPIMRVIAENAPPGELGKTTGDLVSRFGVGDEGHKDDPYWQGPELPGQESTGHVLRVFNRRDGKFSPFLRKVNRFLDGMDASIAHFVSPVLPERVRENPKTMAQVGSLGTAIVFFLVMAFLAGIGNYAQNVSASLLVLKVLISLRVRLLKNLLYQPLAFYNAKKRGELISRMGSDVQSATVCLTTLTSDMVRQPLMVLFPVIAIGLIKPWLLLIVGIFVPVVMVSLRRNSKRVHRRARVRQRTTARVTEAMVQMFSGIRVVKAFGLEAEKVQQYMDRNSEFARDAFATERAKAWTRTRMELLVHVILVVAVTVTMLILGMGGKLPAGAMLLFLVMMAQIFRPVKQLTRAYTDLHDNLAGAERMFEFIDLEPGMEDKPGAIALRDVVGGVRYEDVSFSYNGNGPVLKHINLEIPAGQVVAFVGPSGAGKTTLVNLVPRFYDPGEGRITIDGTDVREFTRESLLKNIAIVTQDPFLFNTSIRENIGHGRPGATQAEIEAAARAANIHKFIVDHLPNGYDTVVGERGANLSGGQGQRLTIARAILRNAKILILDEATSNLDSESERAVQSALQNLMEGRTTLVIAHRLSTIQHADKIVVMQHGQVIEVGSHSELMARDSFYRRLYDLQFAHVS